MLHFFFLGFVRIHILHQAAEEPVNTEKGRRILDEAKGKIGELIAEVLNP